MNGFIPRSFAELDIIATACSQSQFFDGSNSVAQAKVKIMAGMEMGLTPIEAMTGLYIQKGNVGFRGNLAATKIRQSQKYRFKEVESNDKICKLEWFERIDGKWEHQGFSSFTWEQAVKAKLANKDTYQGYAEDMLFNRALMRGQRRFASDVFRLPVYSQDEMEEIAEAERRPAGGKRGNKEAQPDTQETNAGSATAAETVDAEEVQVTAASTNTPPQQSGASPATEGESASAGKPDTAQSAEGAVQTNAAAGTSVASNTGATTATDDKPAGEKAINLIREKALKAGFKPEDFANYIWQEFQISSSEMVALLTRKQLRQVDGRINECIAATEAAAKNG